ncbi:glycoside hydrolase family 15 protein [Croceicoccus sp. F390]|uniref:Glycoside hydrolase family 15 protein n=1 Tax=Croceicoccus esteveae TaxID=3075597 RepID=A0ABU2ZJN7_9SPHN|nr:glycoside hydrolase family 15 protein [Croceicoccus sp. F390]MDT0576815.1 glycoside hydrolase family 15 protein [Croceicoccus sp. F390]
MTTPNQADAPQPSLPTLDLWPIGNCQASALIDREGSFVWGCLPRIDGDPAFCSLLDHGRSPDDAIGFWKATLEGGRVIAQEYIRNTPILRTEYADDEGNAMEIIDFCPRLRHKGRMYRPVAYVRIVRPITGSPRLRMALRPASNWGADAPERSFGSSHVSFRHPIMAMRLTTDAPVGLVQQETPFRVESPLHFFFGPDESFAVSIAAGIEEMLTQTIKEWQHWVRGLAIPFEWQDAVVRAAIGLKLCQHEDTGAIVAAMTTSIPEHAHSGRNWDYRYCWIRDAYFTVQALNRIGALDVLESYLGYLRNIVDNAHGGKIQPLYDVRGNAELLEWEAPHLAGYRAMGPVRVGNDAWRQVQHDVYGQIVLSSAQGFADRRLLRLSGREDFCSLEKVGEYALRVWNTPDAGLWELRNSVHVHTYSAAMCWAAADRLAHAAQILNLPEREEYWKQHAAAMHEQIIAHSWREDSQAFSATFDGDTRDASVLQLLDLRFISKDDPRFHSTLAALEDALRRGDYMLRYDSEDDFGVPHSAFNVCTFWLIESLYRTGRADEARVLFEIMLDRRTGAGMLSEDIDPRTLELWGNYPQTYSLVGIINCAVMLTKSWNEYR